MRHVNYLVGVVLVLGANPFIPSAAADMFGNGGNSFEIDFVTIGNPGNPADMTGNPKPAGSVPYAYRIGKYEISEQMIDKANAVGGLGISKTMRGPNKPATQVSWFEAARFTNWLNTSTGHLPAYKFNDAGTFQVWLPSDLGYDPDNLFRNSRAKYFLPGVHEWYKAAYYDPTSGVYYDFPTGSNVPPVSVASGTSSGTAVYGRISPADITQAGGLSPYGTMAQGGNVAEWNETVLNVDFMNFPDLSGRGIRGGDYGIFLNELLSTRGSNSIPSAEFMTLGFRVGSIVPEPSVVVFVGIGLLGIFNMRIRKSLEWRSRCAN